MAGVSRFTPGGVNMAAELPSRAACHPVLSSVRVGRPEVPEEMCVTRLAGLRFTRREGCAQRSPAP